MNNIRWEKISIFLLSAMVLLYTSWTYERNRVWKDEVSLWSDAASKSPDNPRPFANLGNAYVSIGLYDKAIAEVKEAINIYPYFAKAHNILAVAYINKGMYDEAIVESRLALALKRDFPK